MWIALGRPSDTAVCW